MLQALLRRSANPWASDGDGYSAWDYALDHAKPPALVQVLLENDATFAKQQQHFQAQYGRLCAMLKRTQRYPALGCPCRTCNSMVEIRAPESEASRSVRGLDTMRTMQAVPRANGEMAACTQHAVYPASSSSVDREMERGEENPRCACTRGMLSA